MSELNDIALWIGMGAALFSGIVRGFTGFGAALLAVPVFSILWLPHEAIATMMCLAALSNIQMVPGALRMVEWGQVLPLSLATLLMIPVGALALVHIDAGVMRRVISGIVLAFTLLLMSGWRWKGKPGWGKALLAGGLGGLINGAAGTGGPPIILYLLAGPSSAATGRANIIVVYLFMNGGTLVNLAASGLIGMDTLWRMAWLTPAWVLGLWGGMHLFHHAADTVLRQLALLALLGVALLGLFYPG